MKTKILEGIINKNEIKFICVGQKSRGGIGAVSSVLKQITSDEWGLPSLSELKNLLQNNSEIVVNNFYHTGTIEKVCCSRVVYHPTIEFERIYHNDLFHRLGPTFFDFQQKYGLNKSEDEFETILISGKTNLKEDPFILCGPCSQHSDCHVYNSRRDNYKKENSRRKQK